MSADFKNFPRRRRRTRKTHRREIKTGDERVNESNRIVGAEAGSEAALNDKRDELRAKGVEISDIDHEWSKSIYFKDPNGLSLEYNCVVRNFTEDDATMQERCTVRRAALELSNTTSAEGSAAQSIRGKRKA